MHKVKINGIVYYTNYDSWTITKMVNDKFRKKYPSLLAFQYYMIKNPDKKTKNNYRFQLILDFFINESIYISEQLRDIDVVSKINTMLSTFYSTNYPRDIKKIFF